jgi:hypothetical protein
MRRASVLGVVVGLGAMSMAVAGYQQPAAGGAPPANAPKVVEVEKLK